METKLFETPRTEARETAFGGAMLLRHRSGKSAKARKAAWDAETCIRKTETDRTLAGMYQHARFGL